MNDYERKVADTLDALGIEWEYEPVELQLEACEDGQTKIGFRPDFYLPEYGVWVEATAARSGSTITRKNGRIRRARELGYIVHLVTWRDKDRLTEVISTCVG